MKPSLLNSLFYLGLVFITIGTLFKIQHWTHGRLCQSIGLALELFFFIMVIVEILKSKKAVLSIKITFTSIYTLLPVIIYFYFPALVLIFAILILGSVYLTRVRKKILFTRSEIIARDSYSI